MHDKVKRKFNKIGSNDDVMFTLQLKKAKL